MTYDLVYIDYGLLLSVKMFGGIIMMWLLVFIALVAGLVLGFFISQWQFKKHLRDNPPINEEVVRTMMMQMGRTPSQKQINQVMKQINQNMK